MVDASPPAAEPTVGSVVERLGAVRRRIDDAARAAGRSADDIGVTAVTKAFPAAVVRIGVEAGCTVIGENYAQELLTKVEVLDALAGEGRRPRVDFIGQLQSNKVRQLVGVVDRWCTVDRRSLAKELAKRAEGAEVLVQVDTTGEDGKGGCPADDCAEFVVECRERGLDVVGLLTVGPTHGGPDAARPGFELVRALVDELGLAVASMGMSHDLEVAVAAGSTDVRLGTALFGPRPVSADR